MAVYFDNLFAIRLQQRRYHINPSLLDHQIQILTCGKRDPIIVTLPAHQSSLDWLARLEWHRILVDNLSRLLDVQIIRRACAVNYACCAKSDQRDAVWDGIR